MGQGEIARYKRLVLQTPKTQGVFGKGLKILCLNIATFYEPVKISS